MSDKEMKVKNDEVRKCRICKCTEQDCSQCIERTGQPCSWVEEDLCSACEDRIRESGVMTFHNRTTDDKITISFDHLKDDRLITDINFDPVLGEQKERSVTSNCAGAVFQYLGGKD